MKILRFVRRRRVFRLLLMSGLLRLCRSRRWANTLLLNEDLDRTRAWRRAAAGCPGSRYARREAAGASFAVPCHPRRLPWRREPYAARSACVGIEPDRYRGRSALDPDGHRGGSSASPARSRRVPSRWCRRRAGRRWPGCLQCRCRLPGHRFRRLLRVLPCACTRRVEGQSRQTPGPMQGRRLRRMQRGRVWPRLQRAATHGRVCGRRLRPALMPRVCFGGHPIAVRTMSWATRFYRFGPAWNAQVPKVELYFQGRTTTAARASCWDEEWGQKLVIGEQVEDVQLGEGEALGEARGDAGLLRSRRELLGESPIA